MARKRTGADFSFPFETPYSIQLELMNHLFNSISSSQVTIAESPTGTGKSLSLISSSLTWLRSARQQKKDQIIQEVRLEVDKSLVDEPAWVAEQEVARRLKLLERDELELEERLEGIRRKERERARNSVGPVRKKQVRSPVAPVAFLRQLTRHRESRSWFTQQMGAHQEITKNFLLLLMTQTTRTSRTMEWITSVLRRARLSKGSPVLTQVV